MEWTLWLTFKTNLIPLERQIGVVKVGITVNFQMDSNGHLLGNVASARQANGESGELHGDVTVDWYVDVGRQESTQLALVLDGDWIANLQVSKGFYEYSRSTLRKDKSGGVIIRHFFVTAKDIELPTAVCKYFMMMIIISTREFSSCFPGEAGKGMKILVGGHLPEYRQGSARRMSSHPLARAPEPQMTMQSCWQCRGARKTAQHPDLEYLFWWVGKRRNQN